MKNLFNSNENFIYGKKIYGFDCESAICISEKEDIIWYLYRNIDNDNQYYYTSIITECKDLISTEVIVDGQTIVKTTKNSSLGRAAVGGILFGGAGAIVGAISSGEKSVSNSVINGIDLRLTINNTDTPILNINFLTFKSIFGNEANPYKKDGDLYKNHLAEANHWNGIFSALIKRNENLIREATTKVKIQKEINFSKKNSGALEINKLLKLKEFKLLTTEEYNKLKDFTIGQSLDSNFSIADELIELAKLRRDKKITTKDFLKLKNKIISKL